MPASYEVPGTKIDDIKGHVFKLSEKLLTANGKDKGFTFNDAVANHKTYSIHAMCGAIAAERNSHIGKVLAVDPLCARAPYTAVSMYLTPNLCKLNNKVVYERPFPIGGSNTRKSQLHDRAKTLFTVGLKDQLIDKGLHLKWGKEEILARSAGRREQKSAGAKGANNDGKAKCGKAAGAHKGGKVAVDMAGKGQELVPPPVADELEPTKVLLSDASLAWLFINARVTFEGLIDSTNEVAVSPTDGLGPRNFYASEEGSLTMALPGQPAKAGALAFEEFILFSDGNASKVAAGCKRTMIDAKIGGIVFIQYTQVPAVFGTLSGRNPTKRWRVCLNDDSLTTSLDGIEERIGGDMATCEASEVQGLQHQLSQFFKKVTKAGNSIEVAAGQVTPRKEFRLEAKGRKILLGIWAEICKACNQCRGQEDPRVHDHMTDSLGIIYSRAFKVFIETINDMNLVIPDTAAKIVYAATVPWQFVIKAIVDWASEAGDVTAISNDASRRRPPAQAYTEAPPLSSATGLTDESEDSTVIMYAEEVACLVVLDHVDVAGTITVDKAINCIKNYSRSGFGKELYKEIKWANRPGVSKVMNIFHSVGLLGGYVELDGGGLEQVGDTGFPD